MTFLTVPLLYIFVFTLPVEELLIYQDLECSPITTIDWLLDVSGTRNSKPCNSLLIGNWFSETFMNMRFQVVKKMNEGAKIDNSWFHCLLCPVHCKLYQPRYCTGKRHQDLCPQKLFLQHWGEDFFLWILWLALAGHHRDGSKYSKYKRVYYHLVLVVLPTLSDFDFPFSFFSICSYVVLVSRVQTGVVTDPCWISQQVNNFPLCIIILYWLHVPLNFPPF